MSTRVIINGKEITNPVVKIALTMGLIIIAALFSAIIVFVVLPFVGIVLSLSIGFMAIFIATLIAGFAALVLSTVVFGWLFGSSEFRMEKTVKRK